MNKKVEISFFKQKKNWPNVHILIPIYNAENFIEKTLESITRQDYEGVIHLIIVDDGSTDKSLYVVGEYLKKNIDMEKRTYIQNFKQNIGIASARKALFAKSKQLDPTAYIFCLDADDYYKIPDAISSIMHQMLSTKADICLFNFDIRYEDEKQIANASGLILDKQISEKMLQVIHEKPLQVISPKDYDVMQFTSLGWTKCYGPTVNLPGTANCPFEDFVYMSALLQVKYITALPPNKEIISYLRRSTSVCGKRTPDNFIQHIPAQLERLLEAVVEHMQDDEDKVIKLEYVANFIRRKIEQYKKTLSILVETKTDDTSFNKPLLDRFDVVSKKLYSHMEDVIATCVTRLEIPEFG